MLLYKHYGHPKEEKILLTVPILQLVFFKGLRIISLTGQQDFFSDTILLVVEYNGDFAFM